MKTHTANPALSLTHTGNKLLLSYQYPYKQGRDSQSPVVHFLLSFGEGSETYIFRVGLDGEKSISFRYTSGHEVHLPAYFINRLESSLRLKADLAGREGRLLELFLCISHNVFCLHSFDSFKGLRCWFSIEHGPEEFHLSECFGEVVFQ